MADIVHDAIARRNFERPDVFQRLTMLDDAALDSVIALSEEERAGRESDRPAMKPPQQTREGVLTMERDCLRQRVRFSTLMLLVVIAALASVLVVERWQQQ
jgi:hypothetical protein